jgi:hypothetical protein
LLTNSLSRGGWSHHGFPTPGTTNEIQNEVPNTWQATGQAARQTTRDGSAENDPATRIGGLAGIPLSPDTEQPLSATGTSVTAEVAAPHCSGVVLP